MKVELLDVGWFTAPASLFRTGEEAGLSTRYPVPAYLVETATERVLVDTGLHPAAVADPRAHYGESAEGLAPFELYQERSIAEQVDLSTLTKVVLTHLHFDHAGALALIPSEVPAVVQRREWAAGHDRAAISRNFYLALDYAADRPVQLVDGDHDLLGDGSILLMATPGHTPGHQSVRIGDLVLGGDVTHFASGLDDHRFPVFGDDRADQGRSAERLRALRDGGCTVLPGHDAGVLQPGPLAH